MTSIIIAVHNALQYTQLCISSIRKCTKDFEIIIIDNGSTDETLEWLAKQKEVRFFYNKENIGFPAAVNQGIRIARGKYLCLLNNDIIVTPEWLERMIRSMELHGTGIIGPMTNYCLGKQCLQNTAYRNIQELYSFANALSVNNQGEVEFVDWIIGFCMMFSRELTESIGLFDEGYGIGNSEDIDFCLTARKNGYTIAYAKDVFVHHFGSVTHQLLQLDYYHLLSSNAERLIQKHGSKAERFREYNSEFVSTGNTFSCIDAFEFDEYAL